MKKIIPIVLSLLVLSGCYLSYTEKENLISSNSISSTKPSENSSSLSEASSKFNTSSKDISLSIKEEKPVSIEIDTIEVSKATAKYSKDLIFPDISKANAITNYCYNTLSSTLKISYNKLCKAIEEMHEGFIYLGNIDDTETELVYKAVRADHPEYYWVPSYYFISNNSKGSYIAFKYDNGSLKTDYLLTPENRNIEAKKINQVLKEVSALISNGLTEYEKELKIHNYLLKNCTYNNAATKNPDKYHEAYSILGPLVKKTAVCEGYARTLQLLLNYNGVKNILITGKSDNVGHMWNLVNIGGSWYHLDSTFNDGDDSFISYSNFNLTDNMIKQSHTIDPIYNKELTNSGNYNILKPLANNLTYNYFNVNETLIYDINDLEKTVFNALQKALKNNTKEITFGFAEDVYNNNAALNKINTPEAIYENAKISKTINKLSLLYFKQIKNVSIATSNNYNFTFFWEF